MKFSSSRLLQLLPLFAVLVGSACSSPSSTPPPDGGGDPVVSDAALVAGPGKNYRDTADYTIAAAQGWTPATSGTDRATIVITAQYSTAAGPTAVRGDANGAYALDCDIADSSRGRVQFWHKNGYSTGDSTITVTGGPNRDSRAVAVEYTSISGFDQCSSFQNNASNTYFAGRPLLSAGKSVAIGLAYDYQSASSSFAPVGTWSTLGNYTAFGEQLYLEHILNGAQGQFAALGTSSLGDPIVGITSLYKVAAQTSSGALPTMLADFSGTDGQPVTLDALNASTHGGNAFWTNGVSGYSFSSAAQKSLRTPTAVNGTVYSDSTGSTGIVYDMSANPGSAFDYPVSGTPISVGVWTKIVSTNDLDTSFYSNLGILGPPDYVVMQYHGRGDGTYEMAAECGDEGPQDWYPISTDTWYWVTQLYNQNATHTMELYSASGTLLHTWSCTPNGSNPATYVSFGGPAEGSKFPTGVKTYFDNFTVDLFGKYPLLP